MSNEKTWLLALVLPLRWCVTYSILLDLSRLPVLPPCFHLARILHVNSSGQQLSFITGVCNGSHTAETSTAATIIIKSLSGTLCNSISTT